MFPWFMMFSSFFAICIFCIPIIREEEEKMQASGILGKFTKSKISDLQAFFPELTILAAHQL